MRPFFDYASASLEPPGYATSRLGVLYVLGCEAKKHIKMARVILSEFREVRARFMHVYNFWPPTVSVYLAAEYSSELILNPELQEELDFKMRASHEGIMRPWLTAPLIVDDQPSKLVIGVLPAPTANGRCAIGIPRHPAAERPTTLWVDSNDVQAQKSRVRTWR